MSENASEYLLGRAGRLHDRAVFNRDLCASFLGLVYHTVDRAHQMGLTWEGVTVLRPEVATGNLVRAGVRYGLLLRAPSASGPSHAPQRELRDFLAKRNAKVVAVLDGNPTYLAFLDALADLMERWGRARGVAFADVRLGRARIHQASEAFEADLGF